MIRGFKDVFCLGRSQKLQVASQANHLDSQQWQHGQSASKSRPVLLVAKLTEWKSTKDCHSREMPWFGESQPSRFTSVASHQSCESQCSQLSWVSIWQLSVTMCVPCAFGSQFQTKRNWTPLHVSQVNSSQPVPFCLWLSWPSETKYCHSRDMTWFGESSWIACGQICGL